jgi:triacylglycerol lipase
MTSSPSHPLVLVHGLCGFDRLFLCRRPVKDYFPGLRETLGASGVRVLVPRLSPTAAIAVRAKELKAFIQKEVGQQPVHLVGHSLGGLDARYAISKLGLDRQVVSLTTVGTPHRGSTFADWGLSKFAKVLTPILRGVGLSSDALFDLRTDKCARFNEDVPNVPGVRYQSVAGIVDRPWLGKEWAFSARIVARSEGANDGVVSVKSAAWGEHCDVWTGDHLNVVNWPNRYMRRAGCWTDRAADYRRVLARLAA